MAILSIRSLGLLGVTALGGFYYQDRQFDAIEERSEARYAAESARREASRRAESARREASRAAESARRKASRAAESARREAPRRAAVSARLDASFDRVERRLERIECLLRILIATSPRPPRSNNGALERQQPQLPDASSGG